MFDELRRVISYPKLNFPETLQAEIIETMFSISTIVNIYEAINIIKDDPPDNKIIECAVSAKADLIISGDSHLLKLQRFRGIEILSPGSFFKQTKFTGDEENEG